MRKRNVDWLTRAERTDWEETSRYPEVITYCKQLQKASPWIRYSSFGKSPQGRALPLLTVSSQGVFTPEEARRSDSTVLLIINGIHPGEIAGKEASLMMLRDMAVMQQHTDLLKKIVLLVVPIFSVDGHERFGPFNRINQIGPKEMGWRATAQNLNLNRDWMKADQPEMQAMLRLYSEWLPDFVIDNHVTDGGDYQYDITYIIDDHPRVCEPLRSYMNQDLLPFLEHALAEKGHVPATYFEFKDPNNPAAGIMSPPLSARFSDGYGTLQNRPTIVVETHMLKSFGVRIRAHYDLMIAVLEKLANESDSLKRAILDSDLESESIGSQYDPHVQYPISVELSHSDSETVRFRGIEYTHEPSEVSGGPRIVYGNNPVELDVPYFRTTYADRTIVPPLGYVIPPEWQDVLERLPLHGIEFERLKKAVTGDFETYRFMDVAFPSQPYEGRFSPRYWTHLTIERRTLPEGSAIVWLNQRTNRVILGLFEPESPDSFAGWGFFNAIFEEKEYAEDYILEKLAEKMLAEDILLRQEFLARMEQDTEFESSPAARLRFFYDRSPYRDSARNAYPVVRVTRRDQIP